MSKVTMMRMSMRLAGEGQAGAAALSDDPW